MYRRRRRLIRRRDRRRVTAVAVIGLALVVAMSEAKSGAAGPAAPRGAPSGAVAQVIAYTRAQLACPYVYGGTGPCQAGYDCSGLMMQAFASAGISIPRTSQEQYAAGPQVSQPDAGDEVFFAGADGTPGAPGHVGLVVDPARHLMIDAYATGTPVRYDTYGLPASAGGLADVVGFTDPSANGGAH
jgi:cell wall-associated NlpC family hydrolase